VPGAAFYDGCAGTYEYWSPALGPYIMSPGLGFFTHWVGPGFFSLTGSERAHNPDWFWKDELSQVLTIEASGNGKSDVTHICFLDSADAGFARDGDFYKIISKTVGLPQIYTTIGNEKLSINALPKTDKVTLGFEANSTGTYTISAIETSDFTNIYLEDKQSGGITDLMTSNYSFLCKTGDDPNRFIIHFADESNDNQSNGFVIFSNRTSITVHNINNLEGEIIIYNASGQYISSYNLQYGLNYINLDNATGYYIVNVKTGESVVNKKVYIH